MKAAIYKEIKVLILVLCIRDRSKQLKLKEVQFDNLKISPYSLATLRAHGQKMREEKRGGGQEGRKKAQRE